MLNELQPDLRELLDLVRKVENFDATLAASHMAGKAIEPSQDAYDQRKRHEQRIVQLRDKWAILARGKGHEKRAAVRMGRKRLSRPGAEEAR